MDRNRALNCDKNQWRERSQLPVWEGCITSAFWGIMGNGVWAGTLWCGSHLKIIINIGKYFPINMHWVRQKCRSEWDQSLSTNFALRLHYCKRGNLCVGFFRACCHIQANANAGHKSPFWQHIQSPFDVISQDFDGGGIFSLLLILYPRDFFLSAVGERRPPWVRLALIHCSEMHFLAPGPNFICRCSEVTKVDECEGQPADSWLLTNRSPNICWEK